MNFGPTLRIANAPSAAAAAGALGGLLDFTAAFKTAAITNRSRINRGTHDTRPFRNRGLESLSTL